MSKNGDRIKGNMLHSGLAILGFIFFMDRSTRNFIILCITLATIWLFEGVVDAVVKVKDQRAKKVKERRGDDF